MNLLLWRHAEAEFGAPDMQRQLTPHGHQQAAQIAAWLKSKLPPETTFLVSPAVRAQQTAAALTSQFQTVDTLSPGCGAAEVLRAASWPAGTGTVLVVGHQPVLGRVASLLLTGREAGWEVEKAGLWWFEQETGRRHSHIVLRAVMSADLAA